VTRVARTKDVPAALRPRLEEGDLVITLGAGDVTEVSDQLLAMLRSEVAGAQPGS